MGTVQGSTATSEGTPQSNRTSGALVTRSIALAGAAALVAVVPWIGLALLPVGVSQFPDGSPDNAPVRAQGIMLIASPLLFLLLLSYFLALGGAVRRWRIRGLRTPLFVNLLVAAAFGLVAGVSGYRADGIHTVSYTIATSVLFFASLCFGSGAWWMLARRPTSECS